MTKIIYIKIIEIMMMMTLISSFMMTLSLGSQLLVYLRKLSSLENHIKEIRLMIDKPYSRMIIMMMNSIMP